MNDSESSPRGVTAKLVLLLRELVQHRDPIGVSHLSRSTRLPKTTVHRLLVDLERHGVVIRTGRRYQLASESVWPDHDSSREALLRKVVKPFLLELYEHAGHVVSLAIASGGSARFLDVLYPHRFADAMLRTATAVPLHCTATGKAILAFDAAAAERHLRRERLEKLTRHSIGTREALDEALVETRLRGVAVDREEHVPGFWSIAAPVLGANGVAIAAIGLGGPVRGFQPADHLARLRLSAKRASAALQQHAAPA